MARNILKAGHRLTVLDLRPEATVELERLGATRARDLRSLAQTARVTCTSLPNDAIVQAVVLGEAGREGLLAGARDGDVIFDLSTVARRARDGSPPRRWSVACGSSMLPSAAA